MGASFDEFLGIVPGTSGIGHEDGEQEAGDKSPGKEAAQGLDVDEADREWERNRQSARNEHLPQSRRRADVDAPGVVGLGRRIALSQARDLAELAPYFFDHLVGSPSDGLDRQGCKQKREHGTQEQADRGLYLENVDSLEVHGPAEGEEQSQSRDRSRCYGKTLGDRRGRVAEGVEGIGGLSHLGWKVRHLGDPAGVVGDRPVSVDRYGDTQR